MIFEADPDQISRLDSLQLVQLMKRLLLAECQLVEIPLRATTVPLQITVADGGEDGRVAWVDGAGSTDYFPARFCVFQSKAQNLTESKIKSEIVKRPKKRPAKLNPAVSEVLSRRGAYVVFCSHPFSGQKITRLRKAIEAAIRACHKNPSRAADIEIYDANRIADWVNTHPAVALWLAALQRRRTLAGFKSHDSWARDPEIHEVPWVSNDTPRFAPADILIPDADHKDRSRNAWNFEQATAAIVKALSQNKVALRIVGPSGFGKTRFAFEVFNSRATTFDEIERTNLIYADLAIVGDEVTKVAHEIADIGSPVILVVDECPDEIHVKLVSIARRTGSRLRLVTIDVETKVLEAKDTLGLRLEPAADAMIGAIAHSVAPSLNESETRFIQELAKGFPKMAVLAAQQEDIGGQKAIRSVEQIRNRILWGHRQPDNDAQRAIEVLSLFDWVGLTGPVADDAVSIAEKLGGITADRFVEHVKSFDKRGIIIRRGDFCQVAPIPLAASLAAHRLSVVSADKLVVFFSQATDRLKRSLLNRLRWLDTSPDAKAFARKLLEPEGLGNFAVLNTDFGAECLYRLVHVDPDPAMATIHRVFRDLTNEELRGFESGRRHLVWALEKLAFRNETFDRSATLLRRLAAAETEDRIGNNATGQFCQLYQLHLSGTEAPPEVRLLILDDGLQSHDLRERQVCVEALDKMLDTGHFFRSGGAEEIGSAGPLKDWVPKTYGETWDFFRAAIKRLTDIATSTDLFASRAKEILGTHIRGLLNGLPFDDVKAMISRVVSRHGFWIEAIKELNEWLYFDRRNAPKELGPLVRVYFDELMPSDPVELAALYTHGWQSDFHDPDLDYEAEEHSHIDFEYSTRKAVELAELIAVDPLAIDRAVKALTTSNAKTVFPFARRMGELARNVVDIFLAAISEAETKDTPPNRQFFGGLIAGADSRDSQAARECVRLALRSEKLKREAIYLIGAGRLQRTDIELIIALLREGDIEPRQCAHLSYGRGMQHLLAEDVVPLLDELILHDSDGLWAVLEIVSMIVERDQEPPQSLVRVAKNVLLDSLLFSRVPGSTDVFNLEGTVKLLSRHKLIDRSFARGLVKQLLGICTRTHNNNFYDFAGPVRTALATLVTVHPQEVWNAVARLLQIKNWRVQNYLPHLVALRHEDHLAAGLLYALPADLYLNWARKDPVHRAAIVLDWLPIAKKAENGSLSWDPGFEAFIAEFGNHPKVLRALSMRLHQSSWAGSLVPHLERLLELLNSWSAHPLVVVRHWVREKMDEIRTEIREERRRDDERVVRYS